MIPLLVIIIGGVTLYSWYINNQIKRVQVNGLSSSVGGAENILIAGSTTRCGLKVQNAQWGFCSDGVTGVNSDIIMVVHLVPATHSITLLSIPRDTFVPNARAGAEAFKIDAALYEGPSQLVNAIEEDFGIPIQHYVELNFDGFVNVVNALGGIKMNFPLPVYDAYSHLDIKQAGCTQLNGLTALQLIRARHLQYKPASITTNNTAYWPYEIQSDIGRIARTHEFLKVLASSVQKQGIGNPIKDEQLVSTILPNVTIDSALTDTTILSLINDFHNSNFSNAPEFTLPIAVTPFGSYYYDSYDYGDVVFPVEPTDNQIIDKFLGSSNTIDNLNGKTLPNPSSITVSVMNGSGISDQATTTANDLKKLGFNISQIGTDTPNSTQANETVIYYSSLKDEPQAEAVEKSLSGYVIMSLDPSMVSSGSNITVLTGTSLSVIGIPTTSSNGSNTNSSLAQTSTQTNPVTSSNPSNGFSAPSASNEALTPWDPRACKS
jgi:LCP family protein required for cell wall assembly